MLWRAPPNEVLVLQESDKGQISYWSNQTCSRIMLSIDWLIDWLVTMLKKPQNCPISDFFDLTPKYFLVFLHYTDLVPPSTDPVPPSTNQYRPILTQYHQILTSTAFYWASIIMYQPVLLHTNPVLSYINPHCPILTKYQPVPPSVKIFKCQTFLCRPEMSTVVR